MQFIDLVTQQTLIRDKLDARMQAVLDHGQYIMGPEVKELETKLASYTGAKHCIGCASGTNALELVLSAWNIGNGDAIFTTPLSFIATAEVIAKTGAVPIFVDIDPLTWNIDSTKLEAAIIAVQNNDNKNYPLPKICQKTPLAPRAIIAVDLFGNPADYDNILSIANKYALYVMEDGAQGLGSTYKGNKLCNCGCHAATTSFFPAKPLGCYGDGGAVFTNDPKLAHIVDSLRYHGRIDAQNKNENIRLGYNGRLDTLQAAILLAKMEIFAEEITARYKVGAYYTDYLQKHAQGIITTQELTNHGQSNWAQYTVILPNSVNREEAMQTLKKEQIPTAINYPLGMHTQKCFSYLGYNSEDFPNVEAITPHVLSLPMHPYLTEEMQDHILQNLLKICQG